MFLRHTLLNTRSSITASSFSQDSTVLAAGFSESYIRLWNLKGDKLKGMRSDFNLSAIKDGMFASSVYSCWDRTLMKLQATHSNGRARKVVTPHAN